PRVRGWAPRLPVLALEHGHLHAARLEGSLLPDREDVLRRVVRLLERDRLGVLGVAPGPALPELRDALRLRGVGRARAPEEPGRHGPPRLLEPPRLTSASAAALVPVRSARRARRLL